MKINQLKNFVAVVDYGSINKAAEKTFVSQPNLSRSIQSLEEEMGKELLVRNNRGVSMTPTGRLLYYYSQSIINELNVLERLKGLEEKQIYSQLSVSVHDIFLKDNLIFRCYEKLLSSETEIQLIETNAEGVFDNVRTSKSEIGITIINSMQLQVFRKMAEIQNMEMTILGDSPIYIHMNDKNPLTKEDHVRFSALTESVYIHLPMDFFSNLNNALKIDGMQLSNFPNRLVMSNYHAILSVAKQTNSFLIGHKWQVEELKHSHMKSMLLDDCVLQKHFILLHRKNEIVSNAAEIFIDLIKSDYGHL